MKMTKKNRPERPKSSDRRRVRAGWLKAWSVILAACMLQLIPVDSAWAGGPEESFYIRFISRVNGVVTYDTLTVSGNYSIFNWGIDLSGDRERFDEQSMHFEMHIADTEGSFVIKDGDEQMMYSLEQTISGRSVTVSEPIPEIPWSITSERKEMEGFELILAVGTFRGRLYEAWFTPDIPVANGPWKLGGLPGLIMEAADTTGEISFRFTGMSTSGSSVNKMVPGASVSYEEFVRLFRNDMDHMIRFMDSRAGIHTDILMDSFFHMENLEPD